MKYSFQEIRSVIFKEVGNSLIKMGDIKCDHGTRKTRCKKCNGGSICEHDKRRDTCRKCKGSRFCEHDIQLATCHKCGGSSFCEHHIQKHRCILCNGSSICTHNKRRDQCKICDPCGHIIQLRRSRRYTATNGNNPTGSLDDLCMTVGEWIIYLHTTFEDKYGRPKTVDDKVHIDEIIPCSAWNFPDDNKYCWHYLNSQWLFGEDNMEKRDIYTEENKIAMIKQIDDHLDLIHSFKIE